MKKLNIIQLGVGNVGETVIEQIYKQKKNIKKEFSVELNYYGLFNSRHGVYKNNLSKKEVNYALKDLACVPSGSSNKLIEQAIADVPAPFVLIDTSASDKTIPLIEAALERKGFVVLANKKPLSGKWREFEKLHKLGNNHLLYETTVGAGLPVIQTIKNLQNTGDEIIEIQGCFSGTLGYLFSQLEKGKAFSEAVKDAKKKGFTEPDPRDDLSGRDVARKALILARMIGHKINLEDIRIEKLYPKEMQNLHSEEFFQKIPALDEYYRKKLDKARKENKVLRFVATVNGHVSVDLKEIDAASDIGNLKGPDNLIVLKSKRYYDNPLVIKGPGAGKEVTAAGIFSDIVAITKIVKGTMHD